MTFYYEIQNNDEAKSVSKYWPIVCKNCKQLIAYGYANCSDDSTNCDTALCRYCFVKIKAKRIEDI